MSSTRAHLSADGVIRFDHESVFIEALSEELVDGQLWVKHQLTPSERLFPVTLLCPGADPLHAEAQIVETQNDTSLLHFLRFTEEVMPKLLALAGQLEAKEAEGAIDLEALPSLESEDPTDIHEPVARATLPFASMPVVKVTAGGVLRLPDALSLLGLYLAELRHGALVAYGGPGGAPGEACTLKISLGRVVSLPAQIHARDEPWVALKIPDAAPVLELLAEAAPTWFAELPPELRAAIAAQTGTSPSPRLRRPSTDDLVLGSRPPLGPQGRRIPSRPPPSIRPSPAAELPQTPKTEQTPAPKTAQKPTPSPASPAAKAPEPTPESKPEASDPLSEMPRREGQLLCFNRCSDLARELEHNLVNGGLFVLSEPQPLRSRHRFGIQLEGFTLPDLEIDAEVVYSHNGRVGYSVNKAVPLIEQLRGHIANLTQDAGPLQENAPVELGRPQVLNTGDVEPSHDPMTADLDYIEGEVEGLFESNQILLLPAMRVQDRSRLNHVPALLLFDFIAQSAWRGILTVTQAEHEIRIWFHEGKVAFLRKTPFEERFALGRLLVSRRRLSEHQLQSLLQKAKDSGRSLGRTLVMGGHLSTGDLVRVIREQTHLLLDFLFSMPNGHFSWEPWTDPPGRADLVLVSGTSVITHYLQAQLDAMTLSQIEKLAAGALAREARLNPDDAKVASLRLAPKELRYVQNAFSKPQRISSTIATSGLGRLTTLKLLVIGIAQDLLLFDDSLESEAAREQSTRTSVVKLLSQQLQEMNQQNHFDVLGVHWTAHPRHYESAYQQAIQAFQSANDSFRLESPDVKRLLIDIKKRIDDAYTLLTQEDRRNAYRNQLFDNTERQYAADMLVKQAEVSLMRDNRTTALEKLEVAVELDPSDRNRNLLRTARQGRR